MVNTREGWFVLLGLWVAAAGFSVISTIRWMHQQPSAKRTPIILSGAAAIPGLLLILQVGWKLIGERFFHAPEVQAYDLVMTPVSFLWWVVGPILLLIAFVRASVGKLPAGTMIVQISHTILWALSSFISLEFAIRI